MRLTLPLVTLALGVSSLSGQTYYQNNFESETPGQKPSGVFTLSPSTPTATNGAIIIDGTTTPANPFAGKALYLYDLSGDLSAGEPTHLRRPINDEVNVSNVRIDFDFRRGFQAIVAEDADTRVHFGLGRAGDALNNSDFRPFEVRIVNNGDLVVNSPAGSPVVGSHLTDAINHLTLLVNSHDTNAVAYDDSTLGAGSIAPNTVAIFLNGVSVGTFDFFQTPDPVNAPQIDFLAENNDLGQFAFYQDSKRQGALIIDNFEIRALAAPATAVVAPTDLSATPNGAFAINLAWTDNADNESLYRIERKIGAGEFATLAEVAANTVSYTDATVAESTSYTYRVLAGTGFLDSDPSNEALASTPAQVMPVIQASSAPTLVVLGGDATISVTAVGQGTLTYQWYTGQSGDTAAPIADATSASLTLPAIDAAVSVWVRVTNASGSVDSATFSLPVRAAVTSIVNTVTELNAKIAAAGPGDVIKLANGTWANTVIKFSGTGTSEYPITVGAETPGKVFLSGAARAEIGGQYLILRDLIFQGTYSGNDDEVIQFRTGSNQAIQCRVTNISIIDYYANPAAKLTYVGMYGQYNRVDHCYFKGHDVIGVTLIVWLDGSPNYHRVDHNHFADRKSGGGENGWETIRIGDSSTSEQNSRTTVDFNLFERVDGEIETISNKSCENVYRYNTYLEVSGTLSLRHGNRCIVDSNLFIGNGRDGTGGVRVIGEDHVVINNHFERTQARDGGAITIYAGLVNPPLNEYFAAHRALVANNTFVDNPGLAIEVGTGYGSRERVVLPTGVRLLNNVMVRSTSNGGNYVGGVAASTQTWTTNLVYNAGVGLTDTSGFVQVDPQVEWDPLRLLSLPSATGPVVGAATLGVDAAALDAEGNPRGDVRDLGAFEVSSSAAGVAFGQATRQSTGPSYLSVNRELTTPNAQLINGSVRALSDVGEATLIKGFVVGGRTMKSVLIRAVGPGLARFDVENTMSQPKLTLFNKAGIELATNSGWEQSDAAEIARASDASYAFSLAEGSADAALVVTLAPGSYTAQALLGAGTSGIVLLEVYDLTPGNAGLLNESARGEVRTGQEVLIAGFVVSGNAPRKALVRCAGPTLAQLDVESGIADPLLTLYNSSGVAMTSNDNWSESADATAIAAAFAATGAFAFPDGSKDSAVLVTLSPGLYTAHASGVDGATGTTLLEVYFLNE